MWPSTVACTYVRGVPCTVDAGKGKCALGSMMAGLGLIGLSPQEEERVHQVQMV